MDVLMEVKDIPKPAEEAEVTETCNCVSVLKNTHRRRAWGSVMAFLGVTTTARKGIGSGRKDWQEDHKLSKNRRYYRNPDHIRTCDNKP